MWLIKHRNGGVTPRRKHANVAESRTRHNPARTVDTLPHAHGSPSCLPSPSPLAFHSSPPRPLPLLALPSVTLAARTQRRTNHAPPRTPMHYQTLTNIRYGLVTCTSSGTEAPVARPSLPRRYTPFYVPHVHGRRGCRRRPRQQFPDNRTQILGPEPFATDFICAEDARACIIFGGTTCTASTHAFTAVGRSTHHGRHARRSPCPSVVMPPRRRCLPSAGGCHARWVGPGGLLRNAYS